MTRTHIQKTVICSIIILLTFVSSAHSAESVQIDKEMSLSAAPGSFRFPFFESDTPVWQYNGKTPGPLIRVKEGTNLTVTFNNNLTEPSTIHWHGIRGENEMDGVPGVTQPAVEPGESFIYRLHLNEAGTYWYHPHLNNSEQIERGLKGVLIVEEKEELPWSEELVWLLDDWLLQQDGTIFPYFNTHRDLMHDGRWGNAITVNGKPQPEFTVQPGARLRLRLINGANARIFSPRLEGLNAQVIAVDGRPVTEIFQLTSFHLSPGNRIDLDITIPADAAGKTFTFTDVFPRNPYTVATLRVKQGAAISTPDFQPRVLKEFIPAAMFEEVPVSKTWDLNAFRGGKYGIGWGMNRRLWPDGDTAELQLTNPQKIEFRNSSTRLHPMHLHGVFFRVLERNGRKAVEPFTRDTVLVGPREQVVIGFIPEHEGIWATHCHILEHAEAGMMTTFSAGKKQSAQ